MTHQTYLVMCLTRPRVNPKANQIATVPSLPSIREATTTQAEQSGLPVIPGAVTAATLPFTSQTQTQARPERLLSRSNDVLECVGPSWLALRQPAWLL